ncbi:MAG: hypothetical protein K0Q73_5004 [Paenibacillus sp.]|nr:hypothetical protein [Paenibacillus sp.]
MICFRILGMEDDNESDNIETPGRVGPGVCLLELCGRKTA